jgi:hypothetical protein
VTGGQPVPAADGPTTLSHRVGALAEALEGNGRFDDAALLYDVQNLLNSLGH